MRTLTVDIETSPALADVWSLWKQNVGLSQLREVTHVICLAAKWHGEKGSPLFYSDHHDGHEQMIDKAYALIDEADAVVHFNGNSFDMPHLHREFLLAGFPPPSPYKNIDLLLAVRKQFRFLSNKLQHVATELGLGSKTQHAGHELWVKCMAGDEAAWNLMRKYNKQDVALTEKLYDRLLPWIPGHPHVGLYDSDGDNCCGRCGSKDLTKQGFAYTLLGKYQQYQCKKCGSWSRGKKAIELQDARAV